VIWDWEFGHWGFRIGNSGIGDLGLGNWCQLFKTFNLDQNDPDLEIPEIPNFLKQLWTGSP